MWCQIFNLDICNPGNRRRLEFLFAKKYEKAIETFDQALEYFKIGSDSEAAAYNNMGQEYLSAQKYEKA